MARCSFSKFQKRWLSIAEFSGWLAEDPIDEFVARCKLCMKEINLKTMGLTALRSHETSKGHQSALANMTKQVAVSRFFQPSSAERATSQLSESSEEVLPSASPVRSSANTGSPGFVVKEAVTRAEIIWACKGIVSHYSFRSNSDTSDLFQLMFPDSDVAKQFSMGYDKASYLVHYGLAPYFKGQMCKQVVTSGDFVICFDESLNKVVQQCQMDLIVRFWNCSSQLVSTRYLTSVFLGRSGAEDVKDAFLGALDVSGLDRKHLLQVSMDGPSVNWSFLGKLKGELQDVDTNPGLLELGSCGLHVVNGAFQTGHREAKWDVNGFLACIYYLFKDSPARRAEFSRITGSKVFGKKFCAVRWTENSDVTTRALEVMSSLQQYVAEVKPVPKVQSFARLKQYLADPLLAAKLEFFRSVSHNIEPFLRKFQTDKPMSPLLFEAIQSLVLSLLSRFVKPEIITAADSANKIMNIDVLATSPSIMTVKKIDVGFGAEKALASSGSSELRQMEFRGDCKLFLSAAVRKILERSPVKYPAVRAISCLSPKVISQSTTLANARMKKFLAILVSENRISALTADSAKSQFAAFCSDDHVKTRLQEFSESNDRIDSLYHGLLAEKEDYTALWPVVQKALILSHGNAAVESGFSINTDILVQNLQEESLIAQRHVFDGIKNAGGVQKLQIDKAMLQSVRAARGRYRDAIEAKRRRSVEEQHAARERKRAALEIETLKAKKQQLDMEAASTSRSLALKIKELERIDRD